MGAHPSFHLCAIDPSSLPRLTPCYQQFHRRTREGGSWHVRISLAQVGRWLVERGQVPEAELKSVPKEFAREELERWSMTSDTPLGRLQHLGPVMRLSETPPRWARPTVPLGYNEPAWPTSGPTGRG